jgi:hypothetical protein
MMKRYFVFLLVVLASLPALGQELADYYQIPDQRHQYDRLLARYGGAYTRDRWYVSLNGFVRTDRAKLDNSFNDLIGSDRVTKLGWSALIGWAYRERWAVEAGYVSSPTHTEVLVNSGVYPYTFRFSNDKQGLVLRGKRMILSTSGPWNRSGFWLTGGLWITPNINQDKGKFALSGYGYRDWRREKLDTLRLSGQTITNAVPTAMAELGVEYNVRLNNQFDMGFSVRKLWGLGSSIKTDVTYNINGREAHHAQFDGTGSGMTYGLTLRYTFALRQTLSNVLDIQGKKPTGRSKITPFKEQIKY